MDHGAERRDRFVMTAEKAYVLTWPGNAPGDTHLDDGDGTFCGRSTSPAWERRVVKGIDLLAVLKCTGCREISAQRA